MKCETVREALSARLDGEQEPVPAEMVDRHLTACSACQDWYRRADAFRRATILHRAPVVPDLTAAVMAQLPAPRRARQTLRVLLAVVAITQTGLALAELFGADPGMGSGTAFMMGHMSHESAAWNVAIGIGLAWAALRTRAAAGQLPMMTVFVGVLAAASLLDLAEGEVTVMRLLSHVPVVVGVALLYLVHRQHRDDEQPLPGRTLPAPGGFGYDRAPGAEPVYQDPRHSEGYQRPASRRAA
ncbi:putative anti-sigma-YlaC factor YlaD [Nocardia sp. GAS34]|uniref:zf-HC2 domain-containing protein n=1 Tax=unclassified Nocardia TaxID=2637762 RepID=UPI003D23DFBD